MLEMPCEFEGVAYEKLRDMQRARRERNLEHLREGVGLAQAARAVGVSKRAGKVWRNGRTRLSGRDERALVDRYSGGGVEKPKGVDGHHLSLEERIEIADTPRAGCSPRQIAEKLGRSPSTIGREVRNNAGPTGEHGPYRAQQMSSDRLRRPKPAKIASGRRSGPSCVGGSTRVGRAGLSRSARRGRGLSIILGFGRAREVRAAGDELEVLSPARLLHLPRLPVDGPVEFAAHRKRPFRSRALRRSLESVRTRPSPGLSSMRWRGMVITTTTYLYAG